MTDHENLTHWRGHPLHTSDDGRFTDIDPQAVDDYNRSRVPPRPTDRLLALRNAAAQSMKAEQAEQPRTRQKRTRHEKE